ncbi:MAG: peroxiredoxin [Pseudomonadota bacterium]|nr:peroxiredoxin [Pseudomonadota bacterium]
MVKVPTFNFSTTLNRDVKLTDYRGMNIVLVFHPKDNTGCIQEVSDFRARMQEFTALNTVVFGISRDSQSSHLHFKEKHSLPFEFISDRDERFCKHFDVIRAKKLAGITYDSIVRSTFLINTQGTVVKAWRNVEVAGHVAEVLDTVRDLDKNENPNHVPAELLYGHKGELGRFVNMN